MSTKTKKQQPKKEVQKVDEDNIEQHSLTKQWLGEIPQDIFKGLKATLPQKYKYIKKIAKQKANEIRKKAQEQRKKGEKPVFTDIEKDIFKHENRVFSVLKPEDGNPYKSVGTYVCKKPRSGASKAVKKMIQNGQMTLGEDYQFEMIEKIPGLKTPTNIHVFLGRMEELSPGDVTQLKIKIKNKNDEQDEKVITHSRKTHIKKLQCIKVNSKGERVTDKKKDEEQKKEPEEDKKEKKKDKKKEEKQDKKEEKQDKKEDKKKEEKEDKKEKKKKKKEDSNDSDEEPKKKKDKKKKKKEE